MSALSIVEYLDVVEDLGPRLVARREGTMMDKLVFQIGEEALDDGVVVDIALVSTSVLARGWDSLNPGTSENPRWNFAGVLASSVAMPPRLARVVLVRGHNAKPRRCHNPQDGVVFLLRRIQHYEHPNFRSKRLKCDHTPLE